MHLLRLILCAPTGTSPAWSQQSTSVSARLHRELVFYEFLEILVTLSFHHANPTNGQRHLWAKNAITSVIIVRRRHHS